TIPNRFIPSIFERRSAVPAARRISLTIRFTLNVVTLAPPSWYSAASFSRFAPKPIVPDADSRSMKTSMRLRTFTALFFISAARVLAGIGTAGQVPSFDELVLQGRAAFLVSDLDRAEAAYNKACPAELVGEFPVAKAVTCENLLASVDEARGNLSRAEQRYLHAVAGAEQAGPAYRPLYCARLIDLGEHYRRQGELDKAETTFLRAVELARTIGAERPILLPEAL